MSKPSVPTSVAQAGSTSKISGKKPLSPVLIRVVIGFVVASLLPYLKLPIPEEFLKLIGIYFYGLTFGVFVLVPLALRLRHGTLRAIAAVLLSVAVYSLMVNWVLHIKVLCFLGEVQGFSGALLLMFGVRDLLQLKYPPKMFAWVLPLCALSGVMIVGPMVAIDAGESPLSMISFYAGHLFWQAVVAIALTGCVTERRIAIPPPPPGVMPMLRIASDGHDLGELPVATVRLMLQNGKLTSGDYYFDSDVNEWKQISSCAALLV